MLKSVEKTAKTQHVKHFSAPPDTSNLTYLDCGGFFFFLPFQTCTWIFHSALSYENCTLFQTKVSNYHTHTCFLIREFNTTQLICLVFSCIHLIYWVRLIYPWHYLSSKMGLYSGLRKGISNTSKKYCQFSILILFHYCMPNTWVGSLIAPEL